jgi:hypothetical protein
MPARRSRKRFATIAIERGYITEGQFDDAIIAQMTDEVFEKKHRRIGKILFEEGHITVEQIDEVLEEMKQSLS